MSASEEYCCLCHFCLADAKGKGRHRKLNGNSVITQKEILRKCAMELDCLEHLQSILMDKDAMICYTCICKLNRLEKLKGQVQQLNHDIVRMLNTTPATLSSDLESRTPQRLKRSRAPSQPAKRVRTSVSFLLLYNYRH